MDEIGDFEGKADDEGRNDEEERTKSTKETTRSILGVQVSGDEGVKCLLLDCY